MMNSWYANTCARFCRCWVTPWWPWPRTGTIWSTPAGGHIPDLIIADVRMQDMDGDDAIREICRDRPTPFILISAL